MLVMNEPHDKILNYGICVFGVIGSLLFSGLFGHVSPTLLFFWGIFSLGLVLISALYLVGTLVFSISPRFGSLVHFLQLLCNVLPSVYLLIGYAEKTQISTPPGCC